MKGILLVIFSVSLFVGFAQNVPGSVRVFPDSIPANKPLHHTLKTVSVAAGYAGATFLCYRFLDNDIRDFAQRNQSKAVTSFAKTYEYAGLGTSSLVITAGVAVTSIITRNKKMQKTAILLAGAHALNDFVTNQFKITFQRHRPNTGDPYNTFDWRGGPKTNTSFISAHTSNAFVTATAFATVYGDRKWVPVAAYSAASLVGLCRVYNNAHWMSDVMGGAAIGFLSVKTVNTLYKIAEKKVTFLPQVSNGHYGIAVICFLEKPDCINHTSVLPGW